MQAIANMGQSISVNWFDGVVAVWLILGFYRGRKNGMSEELLLVFQWLAILWGCSQLYYPIGALIANNTPVPQYWGYVIGYVTVAILISAVVGRMKSIMGEKLVGSDLFGNYEYYLGMLAGIFRFFCMIVCLLAVLNFKVASQKDIEEAAKAQKQALEDIHLPTPSEIQRGMLFGSMTGRFVTHRFPELLIVTSTVTTPPARKNANNPAHQEESRVNEVMGGGKK